MTSPGLVSVIVPVRDNAAGIDVVVRSLAAQTLPRGRFEIVIGDDGSQPGSLAGVETIDGWVRVVSGPPRTSYAARNRAARAARGAVLAFCDSDCVPKPTWLEEGLAALEGNDLIAGEVQFVSPARPTVWSILTADMFLDQQRNVMLSQGVTANLFVTRRVFEATGGFDDSLPSGGDYDFVLRAVERGACLMYAPRAVVRHPTLDDRRAFLRKVWTTNRWAAARHARDGRSLDLSAILTFIPFVGAALARRYALRPVWRLCHPRLATAGLRTSWWDEVHALTLLYFLVCYVAGLSRVLGWLKGLRLARERAQGGSGVTGAPLKSSGG